MSAVVIIVLYENDTHPNAITFDVKSMGAFMSPINVSQTTNF